MRVRVHSVVLFSQWRVSMISQVGAPVDNFYNFSEVTITGAAHRVFKKKDVDPGYLAHITDFLTKPFQRPASDTSSPVFFTSRQQKFNEVATLLQGIDLVRQDKDLPTRENEENLVSLAVYHVFKAFKKCAKPCFVEEAALNVEVDGYRQPWPGHYWRHGVEHQMGKQAFARQYDGKKAETLSVFAYTEDGKIAHVFSDAIKGTIVNPGDSWVEADGWDPFFQPSGYSVPMSELLQSKHIFNMRLMPCAEMRSVMRKKDYPGIYEVHVTVKNTADLSAPNILTPAEDYIALFKKACEELRQKPLVIAMDKREKPMQLQTARYYHFPNFTEAMKRTCELANQLQQKGLPVLRVRIEAMLHNQDSPKTDDEALQIKEGNYFEMHARLVDVKDLELFKQILLGHNRDGIGSHEQGRIKTVFSTVGGGTRYFANMRCYKLGSISTMTYWKQLLKELEASGFAIAKEVKPEYCIYDEKPTLDGLTISVDA